MTRHRKTCTLPGKVSMTGLYVRYVIHEVNITRDSAFANPTDARHLRDLISC